MHKNVIASKKKKKKHSQMTATHVWNDPTAEKTMQHSKSLYRSCSRFKQSLLTPKKETETAFNTVHGLHLWSICIWWEMNPPLNVRCGFHFSRPYYWKTEIVSIHPHSHSDWFPLFQRQRFSTSTLFLSLSHSLFLFPGRTMLFITLADCF